MLTGDLFNKIAISDGPTTIEQVYREPAPSAVITSGIAGISTTALSLNYY